jgi:hypothetical protein
MHLFLNKRRTIQMKYFILFFALLICVPTVQSQDLEELEFGEWFGVYDEAGDKNLVGFSGSDDVTLTIYVDKQLITRLQFNPEKKVRLATFDGKKIRGMNFNSLYGYDHWIRRMIKHYRMYIWFENDQDYEVFSLKGFSKGIRWLQSK